MSKQLIAAATALCVLLLASFPGLPTPPASETDPLAQRFQETVQPFLKTHCAACHGGEKPKGDFDLRRFTDFEAVVKELRQWENVLEQLETESMPPAKAKSQPTAEQRKQVIAWIREVRTFEGKRNAGDPGPVPARRLSNAEYDYTIRDLTGVDIRPAQEFPVDPANEAGFDNSAESLSLSPALLNKYLEGARKVSEHIVFETGGLKFAEYPVVSDTDRDKYCVRQIIDFYRRQRTDYADYFQAAWRFQHRAALGKPLTPSPLPQGEGKGVRATLADVAADEGVSPKYLATIWSVLTGPEEETGPIAVLRTMWRQLPQFSSDKDVKQQTKEVRAGCERMRDLAVEMRRKLVPTVKNLTAPSMHSGSQPLILWKNRQFVANRMRYVPGQPAPKLEELAANAEAAKLLEAPAAAAALEKYNAALSRFCAVFPDAFYISERARTNEDPKKEKNRTGRLLNAGFHSMTGYFRDDAPLYDLVLSQAEQRELDRLWLDFDVITGAPIRQYTSFIWFERSDSSFMRAPEFDFARAEDKDSTSEAKIKQLAKVYLNKAKNKGASELAQSAVKEYFVNISADIRRLEKARLEAEPGHLKALQTFAERAYRRPLSPNERDSIAAFYRTLRDKEGLGHQDAIRDSLVSILLSPRFLFLNSEPRTRDAAAKIVPLSDYALASRLSYFLWSSMPDAALLERAAAGDLHKPEVLTAQVRRMVKDERIRGLAVEFAGNWLDFRRFEEHNAVDRDRFKTFTDDLRRAMFEEPVRFFIDVAQSDRSVDDFLFAKHTFVNPLLARHYGMPEPSGGPQNWARVDDALAYQRGGLLPMAVFQTKNAPGLRTSPVKRGYWVVRRLLGEKIPAPPAEVPELPADEAKIDLPLREVLARHRADKNCAACHARFDAIGLAFEGYGPVGELRKLDLGGRPVDARAAFPGGGEGNGLEGLRTYLRQRRHDDFQNHLSRQLLAYALGRTLLPSDDELILTIKQRLAANDARFSILLESIVTSSQFLNRRSHIIEKLP